MQTNNVAEKMNWKLALVCTVFFVVITYLFPSSPQRANLPSYAALFFPSLSAFATLLWIDEAFRTIDNTRIKALAACRKIMNRSLITIADSSLSIIAVHGCIFTILEHNEITSPLILIIAGILLPISVHKLGIFVYPFISPAFRKLGLLLIDGIIVVGKLGGHIADCVYRSICYFIRNFRKICTAAWHAITSFCVRTWTWVVRMFREIMDATSTQDE